MTWLLGGGADEVEEAQAGCESCTVHGGPLLKRCINMFTSRDSGVTQGRQAESRRGNGVRE